MSFAVISVLKSRGAVDCETSVQKLIEFYPKFVPLLHTRIPRAFVPHIWNDPIVRQIVSIFGTHQVGDKTIHSWSRLLLIRSRTNPSLSMFQKNRGKVDVDCCWVWLGRILALLKHHDCRTTRNIRRWRSSVLFWRLSTTNENESCRWFVHPTSNDASMSIENLAHRTSLRSLPRRVVKFGFREIDSDSMDSPREEKQSRSRKRRVYMHILVSSIWDSSGIEFVNFRCPAILKW